MNIEMLKEEVEEIETKKKKKLKQDINKIYQETVEEKLEDIEEKLFNKKQEIVKDLQKKEEKLEENIKKIEEMVEKIENSEEKIEECGEGYKVNKVNTLCLFNFKDKQVLKDFLQTSKTNNYKVEKLVEKYDALVYLLEQDFNVKRINRTVKQIWEDNKKVLDTLPNFVAGQVINKLEAEEYFAEKKLEDVEEKLEQITKFTEENNVKKIEEKLEELGKKVEKLLEKRMEGLEKKLKERNKKLEKVEKTGNNILLYFFIFILLGVNILQNYRTNKNVASIKEDVKEIYNNLYYKK